MSGFEFRVPSSGFRVQVPALELLFNYAEAVFLAWPETSWEMESPAGQSTSDPEPGTLNSEP